MYHSCSPAPKYCISSGCSRCYKDRSSLLLPIFPAAVACRLMYKIPRSSLSLFDVSLHFLSNFLSKDER